MKKFWKEQLFHYIRGIINPNTIAMRKTMITESGHQLITILTACMFIFYVSACSQYDDSDFSELHEANDIVSIVEVKDNNDVNADELINLINIHRLGNNNSRSDNFTVTPLKNESNEIYAYAVNFSNNQGFILVSSTKNYTPVLAYSYQGNFVPNSRNQPLLYWLNSSANAICKSKLLPIDSVMEARQLWSNYETKNSVETAVRSRDSFPPEFDELRKIFKDSIGSWLNQHYELYYPYYTNGLPDEYVHLLTDCEGHIHPEYIDWWQELSVVRSKGDYYDLSVEVSTEVMWNQINGFNDSFKPIGDLNHAYAGCVPVAIGQIMRHYRFPAYYNWDSMPLTSPSRTTSDFLYEIAESCEADYKTTGTSVSTKNMRNFLNDKGYHTDFADYSEQKVISSLQAGKMVIMLGSNRASGIGHAWICGGYSNIQPYTTYEAWTFNRRKKLNCVEVKQQNLGAGRGFFYMNWGWDSENPYQANANGYYLIGNFKPNGYNSDYSLNNRIIYNIYPK